MTFRTTLRETRKSRQIALIVIFREKYARRILAIVSTISISNSASQTTRRPVWTLIPGVPIGCRSPRKRGPYSMPNDTHCAGRDIVAWGRANGLARYRCKSCGRTFNALTKTAMAGLRKKEQWLDHAQAMIEAMSVAKAAER